MTIDAVHGEGDAVEMLVEGVCRDRTGMDAWCGVKMSIMKVSTSLVVIWMLVLLDDPTTNVDIRSSFRIGGNTDVRLNFERGRCGGLVKSHTQPRMYRRNRGGETYPAKSKVMRGFESRLRWDRVPMLCNQGPERAQIATRADRS